MMDELMPTQFVTIATHSERYFPILQESAKRNKINLTVLGWGQTFTGHYMKDDMMLNYLQTLPEDENPLIVFMDGFDSIILASEEEFTSKWEHHQKKTKEFINNAIDVPQLLVSRDFDPEWLAHPLFSYNYSRVFYRCSDIYINAGQFMGRKQTILEFLTLAKRYRDPNISSNQLIWSLAYRDNGTNPPFVIDTQANIFLNLCITNTTKGLEIAVDPKNKRVNLGITGGTQPCIISGPGSSNLDDIARQLGYTVDNPQTSTIRWKSYIKKIPYYISIFYPEIIIITGVTMLASTYLFNR
jgi:hypothetical protein